MEEYAEAGGFEADDVGPGGGFCGTSCCEECGCLSFSQEYYSAFTVMVCHTCRRSDRYSLIPKGTAKDTYLLTDTDLKRLGFITKNNPQHKQWSDMKLYLRMQVEQAAIRKHGSLDALQAIKQARVQARLASRVDRGKRPLRDFDPSEPDSAAARDTQDTPPEGWQGDPQEPPMKLTAAQQRVRARLVAEYCLPSQPQPASHPAAGSAHSQASGSTPCIQLDPPVSVQATGAPCRAAALQVLQQHLQSPQRRTQTRSQGHTAAVDEDSCPAAAAARCAPPQRMPQPGGPCNQAFVTDAGHGRTARRRNHATLPLTGVVKEVPDAGVTVKSEPGVEEGSDWDAEEI